MRPSSLMLQLLKLFPEKRLEQPEEEKEALWSPELGMSWVLPGDCRMKKAGKMTSLYRCTDTLFRQNRTGMKCRRSRMLHFIPTGYGHREGGGAGAL